MPQYCYKSDDEARECPMCADGFEVLQPLSEAALAACPACQLAIHRIVRRSPECVTNQRWNTKKLVSDSNLRKNGFKKLVKQSDGKYVDVLNQK